MSDIQKLEDFATYLRNAIEEAKALLALHEKNLKETEAAIAAARLQAWYRDNPGIALKEGDELAVTEEFMETNSLGAVWWEGEGYPIEEVYFFGDDDLPSVLICETNGGNPESVPMPLARRMREAWLQEHGEAQS
jgi:hypothetical protein